MEKKVVVITGSSKGIGYHLAIKFLEKGHFVVINGRNEQHLAKAKTALLNIASRVESVAGDVSLRSTHEELVRIGKERFGRIDIWINNAGIPQPYKKFPEIEFKAIESIIAVNITGSLLGTRVALSVFKAQGYGTIYNMEGFGSDGRRRIKLGLYGTTKRAINYFNRSLAEEMKESNIRIGSINPGMVRTEFLAIDHNFNDVKEEKQYDNVMRILAEEPEPVCQFIVEKILHNKKSFHRIQYLSGWKLFSKIFRLAIS